MKAFSRGFPNLRNGLQYIYSITVFAGVLVTAYLMMNSENRRGPLRALQAPNPALREEAAAIDPALNQLFEMEEVLARIKRERAGEQKRIPTTSTPNSSQKPNPDEVKSPAGN